ncbi:MAG TPA: nicotinate (nicotinamide) nucleotide adenylyltransferase [Anaerolineales bacterium]|nr:nicotinate (nicotinamide) nucleotide adenylyltransferase [Anaerolineales bacterium]
MRKTIKTGVFGGTFDPPHNGHLALAHSALNSLGLDEVVWMVTPLPPHKEDERITAFHHRLAMVYLCVMDYPQFIVSDLESQRDGPHYTLDTIRILKQISPERELTLLIGGDSLSNFHLWHKPKSILKEIKQLGVFSRREQELELGDFLKNFPRMEEKVNFIKSDPIDISSTAIRQRMLSGFTIKELVSGEVADYILRNRLYRSK